MGGPLLAVSLLVGSVAPVAAEASRDASDDVGVGIRLVDAPVSRRDDERAHRYIIDHVEPGRQIRRRIAVTNLSDTRQRVRLYAAAAAVHQEGFTFAPGRTGNELTKWVTLEPGELVLAPDETAKAWTEITVARDATGGEHYAVLWAEISPKHDPSQQVRNVARAGVRIYLSVGPGGEPRSDFRIENLTGSRAADGVPVVTARVKNTGGRALDLTGKLTLSDGPGGLSAGPVNVKAGTLGPGRSTLAKTTLDPRLPDGVWTARLTLTSGLVKRQTSGRITIGAPQAEGGRNTSMATLTAGGLASVAAAAVLAAYAYRRRNGSR
ncbi:peptidase [Streptomyces sp. HNM0663]|uniref:Peptidase n=1 Tax=Streptomyces chengmaiensis TaxID=3040919 RepID=A0ABT6HQJ5_9ACTN|nr:peptidase [Streptomyces chengmaiensis]MDH2390557.1 peptidase [Streptomyces chengmaiensis]